MNKNIYKDPWFVYIAECRDKTLYVGVAKDAEQRILNHNRTNKCRYTKFRKPLKLRYKETCQDYKTAREREAEIKKFRREKKFRLIESV